MARKKVFTDFSESDVIEETFNSEDRVLVVAKNLNLELIQDTFKEYKTPGNSVFLLSRNMVGNNNKMGFYGENAPSVVYMVNKIIGGNFPFVMKNMIPYGLTKLMHAVCTIDSSLVKGYETADMAISKIRALNSCASIVGALEYRIDSTIEERKDELTPEQILSLMKEVKMRGLEIIRKNSRVSKDSPLITLEYEPRDHKYIDKIRKTFGDDNLESIIVYGTAAEDPEKAGDFDNLVILKDYTKKSYEAILRKPMNETINGKDKDVGIILLESNQLLDFVYSNVSSKIFRDGWAKVIYSKDEKPIKLREDPFEYITGKELFHVGFSTQKNIGIINLLHEEPNFFFEPECKAGLYEYFVKLLKFTTHGLLQQYQHAQFGKEKIYGIIKQFGFDMEEHMKLTSPKQALNTLMVELSVTDKMIKDLYNYQRHREPFQEILNVKEVIMPRSDRTSTNNYREFFNEQDYGYRMKSVKRRVYRSEIPVIHVPAYFISVDELNVGENQPVKILQHDKPEHMNQYKQLKKIIEADIGKKLKKTDLIGLRI